MISRSGRMIDPDRLVPLVSTICISYLFLVYLFRYDMIVVALHDVCFQTGEGETGDACVKCYLRADKIQVRGIENKNTIIKLACLCHIHNIRHIHQCFSLV
jgi:hypothetical protein